MFSGKPGRDKGSPRSKSNTRTKKKVITTRRYSISRGKATPSRSRPTSYAVAPRYGVPPMTNNEIDTTTQRGNIKVVVRVRPPNHRETGPARSIVVQAVDSHIVVFDPVEDNNEFYFHGVKQQNHDYQKRRNRDKKFVFDTVYDPSSTNEEIFNETINPTIDTIINGFNCSVFAYGATGSGKTHTMVGNTETEYGLTYLTVMELYRRLHELNQEYESDIMISYLEVYNEQVKDLLDDAENVINILETQHGVIIPKLSTHKPQDADHILRLLKHGNSRRSQHPTDQNHESSRSHAVFQVCITLRGRYTGLTNSYRAAKLVMVDLAGSERGAATGFQGARFREGASINKSLLALGNCINALAEGKKHIPYRDSKLTRILKDALGGNCKTVMIANVSPSDLAYEDSFNTLKYADRAKRIKFNVKKNVLSYSARAAQYAKVVSEMASQIEYMKGVILEYEKSSKIAKSDASTDMADFQTSEKISVTPVSSPTIQYDKTIVLAKENGTFGGSYADSFSNNYSKPTYLFQQSLLPSSNASLTYSAANVMKLESYKDFSQLLDQKVDLKSRSNDLLARLRDVDCKVKQKELRINGAKSLATKEGFVIKGMERMNKQHHLYLSKKDEYAMKLRGVQDELVATKQDIMNAELAFCANKDEGVLISRREFLQFQKLKAEKSIQFNHQSLAQATFNSMFEELIKSEALLHRSITLLKPRHLLMKHIGHATIENEQEYADLMADFFCSRIHFANNNESTPALSPYCDNINHTASPTMATPEFAQHEDESDVTSSTDKRR